MTQINWKKASEVYPFVVEWQERVLSAIGKRNFLPVAFDLETNIVRKGSPFWPSNEIVCGVIKEGDKSVEYRRPFHPTGMLDHKGLIVLIGANIKFDLHWLRREFPEEWTKIAKWKNVVVWDVLLAEYILSAQMRTIHAGNLDLNSLSQKYGLGGKVSVVSDLIKSGVDPEDMDPDLLEEYTLKDGDDPMAIFWKQLELAESKGMLRNIVNQNEALLCTAEMEWNGLLMDKEKLAEKGDECRRVMEECYATMLETSKGTLKYLDIEDLDCTGDQKKDNTVLWNSAQKLSGFLFGGHPAVDRTVGVKGRRLEEDGHYKSGKNKGQVKHRKVETVEYPCMVGKNLPKEAIPSTGKTVWPSTGKDEIGKLLVQYGDKLPSKTKVFLEALQKYRVAAKMLSTYCEGLVDQTWPDGLLHGNLIQYSTVTGRLSSSAPNLQNIDTSLKEVFIARHENGHIASLDYSQLEVVVQGELSGDPNLRADIIAGVDFHTKRLAYTVPETYDEILGFLSDGDSVWAGKRKKAKTVSFQKAYNAGAAQCAEASGLTLQEVKTIFENEDMEYPLTVKWKEDKQKEAQTQFIRNTHQIKLRDGTCIYGGTGITIGPDGYRYAYREEEAPDWIKYKGLTSIKPTCIANYEVQGFAGRSIVNTTIGKLFRCVMWGDWPVMLLNQIHDCVLSEIIADTKKALDYWVQQVQDVMEDTESLGKAIKYKFTLPLRVDPVVDKYWKKD